MYLKGSHTIMIQEATKPYGLSFHVVLHASGKIFLYIIYTLTFFKSLITNDKIPKIDYFHDF